MFYNSSEVQQHNVPFQSSYYECKIIGFFLKSENKRCLKVLTAMQEMKGGITNKMFKLVIYLLLVFQKHPAN